MQLTVNGDSHDHTGDGSVTSLLAELGVAPDHAAVTVNGDIAFSKDWKTTQLTDGDTVEVLTFVGGG